MTGITQTYRGKVDIAVAGEALFEKAVTSTSPSNEIDLINYSIPVDKKASLLNIHVSCRLETKITIYNDLEVIGSGRTGPANLNFLFNYYPYKELVSGTIKVTCTAMGGRPTTDIEAYLQGRLISI